MIYIYATGAIAVFILLWWVFISPRLALLEQIPNLIEQAKDQRAALTYRDMAISELKRQTDHLSARQTLIEQATFGHSYAERAEGEYSATDETETLPAHQRANMGH